MQTEYIEVAIPIKINSLFTYSLPEGITANNTIGKRVLVNFAGRKLRGFAVKKGSPSNNYNVKPVEKIIDKEVIFTERMFEFAEWIASYYFSGVGEALSLMIPKGIKPKFFEKRTPSEKKTTLSNEQENIYKSIKNDIENEKKRFYLYGVTGSGKSEIYSELIQDTLDAGKSAIFLVPEIALSYQTLDRLKKRFGHLVAVLNSNLPGSYKLGEYLRLLKGEAKIAVGPRSALFAPLDNIGLIIIDEEHEGSYKSDENPRFHARTAAIFWAKYNNAVLLLGSATPAVESWYHASRGFFSLYKLHKRFGNAELPEIKVINSLEHSKLSNITPIMASEINQRLQNKEQIILLQNRRGFSSYIQCKDCSEIIICPRCSVSLTYHKGKSKLICHRCGYTLKEPATCPTCNSSKLKKVGAGTQRIEEELQNKFSFARIKRIDYDTVKDKAQLEKTFEEIEKGKIDIIVGTQMIAKGLHFPNIKFVGIVDADLSLNLPDFKSSERSFALLTQVAGRAGREGTRGEVMIQTTNPENFAIEYARQNNYEKFYNEEIDFRNVLGMPPFVRIARLVIRGPSENKTLENIEILSEEIKKNLTPGIEMLGPAPCMISKINKNYRFQIILKSKTISRIQKIIRSVLPNFKTTRSNYLEIDIDPTDLF